MQATTYKVFKRTAKNFQEFAKARKFSIAFGVSYTHAVEICKNFNENRSDKQIKDGTKYEFEKE